MTSAIHTPWAMLELITAARVSQALYVAAKLGVADYLAKGPATCAELGAEMNVHADALYRVLRALAGFGIFAEDESRRFSLTPAAEFLRDGPRSMRGLAIMCGEPWQWQVWGRMLYSVRTGKPAFEDVFGKSVFQYLGENPDAAAAYDQAMTSVTAAETDAILSAYDFSPFARLADLGGGRGAFLATALGRHAHLRGLLVELPHVVEQARKEATLAALAPRCELAAGNIFISVPDGPDVFMLKRVLHACSDREAVLLLRNCRNAMARTSARLLIAEMVLPPGNERSFGKWLDLEMLLFTPGGRERTADEYGALLQQAGLRLTRVIPTGSAISIIEGMTLP